jgi:hypothetical protein
LENPAILIWPVHADTTKGKNVVIGDPRSKKDVESTPSRKVVVEKQLDGDETITITIGGYTAGCHAGKAKASTLALKNEKREPATPEQKQVV